VENTNYNYLQNLIKMDVATYNSVGWFLMGKDSEMSQYRYKETDWILEVCENGLFIIFNNNEKEPNHSNYFKGFLNTTIDLMFIMNALKII